MQLAITAPSILVSTQAVDFRKSIDGLVDVVMSVFNLDPKEHIMVFHNRARDKVKVLAWHKTGFVLLLKRLEKGRFGMMEDDKAQGVVTLTAQQLSWLLAGLDWIKMSHWGELAYRDFS